MPSNQNTGSFGAVAGGISPALQAAIQRRQTGGGVTDQTTQGSPNAQPMPAVPAPSTPQMVTGGATGGQNATPERVDDAHIILKAMAGRLKSQEKMAEAMVIPPKPTTTGGF